jgi:glucose/sorbosone dehydrogenase
MRRVRRSRTSVVLLAGVAIAFAIVATSCGSSRPPQTRPQCSNGVDDDRDGRTDFPSDPGCDSTFDDSESPDPPVPPVATRPACSDGLDNDNDGPIDYPADPGCTSATDTDESNPVGPGNAHRMILWTSYEALIVLSDADLDRWKSRGVDGIVVQTRYLDEMGGIENWTGDPNDPLSSTPIEGQDVHIKQRTIRDSRFVERCHARGLTVYLGFYLSNYHNLSTPLKVWSDDAGWSEIAIPLVRNIAGAAKLLGMDGLATDSEMYRSEDQTWNWNYPGVSQSEAAVRALARQRGREFMTAVLAGFPHVTIINYRIEIPGDWEERVQLQVNKVAGIWDRSVFPDFWGGMVDVEGFAAIHFLDPIFYKSWHIRSGWDEALEANLKGVRQTLSERWANWNYAASRFFLSPFAWIDPGPSAGSFDDARPPDYVAAQLQAFHKWGEGNLFGLYAQHINDFDYEPYVAAMVAASTPDGGDSAEGTSLPDRAADPGAVGLAAGAGLNGAVGVTSLPLVRVATGLSDPMDAAFTPDGRLFIAERGGAIRIVHDRVLNDRAAITLEDVWTDAGNGVLAIAIDPHFDRTHFVFVLYTGASRSGDPVFRLARFRDVQDTLGERAVLLDDVPASPAGASAALRFGPDGKLYAALDSGGDPRAASSLTSYNGKVLRLDADGTTPADQPMTTPVYAFGLAMPSGLEWPSGGLWIAGHDGQEGGLRPIRQTERASPHRGDVASTIRVANPTAIAAYRGDRFGALRGALLVADGSRIARLARDASNPGRILVESYIAGPSVIRALVVSADGEIYFCMGAELVRVVEWPR